MTTIRWDHDTLHRQFGRSEWGGYDPCEKFQCEERDPVPVGLYPDASPAENVRRSISDWMRFMQMMPAGPNAELDRYIGYWEPYATSHDAFDRDTGLRREVRNAALTLLEGLRAGRAGKQVIPGAGLQQPREK
jgi:hypothetical protein